MAILVDGHADGSTQVPAKPPTFAGVQSGGIARRHSPVYTPIPAMQPTAHDRACRARPADAGPGRGPGSCLFGPNYVSNYGPNYGWRWDLGCRRPKAK